MLNTLNHTKKKAVVLIFGLASILYTILSVSQLFGETSFYSPIEHLLFILYGLSSYFSCAWITRTIIYDDRQLNLSAIIQVIFISGIINAVVTTGIFLLTRLTLFIYLDKSGWYPSTAGIVTNIGYTFFIIHLIIAALYLSYLSLQVSHRSAIRQLAAEKENANAQFKLLQQQITPHFLFNSLNVLASLIPIDAKLAEQYVTKFSNLYRFVLNHKDEELISLADELQFITQYCEVMNIRFENAYKLVIEQAQESISETMIAPGAIQTCVENAIKHNIASTREPLTISVTFGNDMVHIENPLRQKLNAPASTKTGLENLVKRYQSLSDSPVTILKTSELFRVSIPALILTKNSGQ